jgi:chitinase
MKNGASTLLTSFTCLTIIASLAWLPAMAKPKKPVLAFYTSWDPAGGINYSKVTHILFAFSTPNAGGSVSGYVAGNVVSAAHAAGVKVMASIGGANNSGAFSGIAASSGARLAFANSVKSLCESNSLDGVDIDWEFPANAQDSANFTLLLKQLRTTLGTKVISVDVAADGEKGQWINKAAATIPDFYNVMSYDYTGANDAGGVVVGQHAPYSKASIAMNYWRVKGVPKENIILGVPFYGKNFDAGAAAVNYNSIMSSNPNLSLDADSVGRTYFNGVTTIKKKATLVAQQEYGGIMIWQIAQDMPSGPKSLLDALNLGLEAMPIVFIPSSGNLSLKYSDHVGSLKFSANTVLILKGGNPRALDIQNVLGQSLPISKYLLKGLPE